MEAETRYFGSRNQIYHTTQAADKGADQTEQMLLCWYNMLKEVSSGHGSNIKSRNSHSDIYNYNVSFFFSVCTHS